VSSVSGISPPRRLLILERMVAIFHDRLALWRRTPTSKNAQGAHVPNQTRYCSRYGVLHKNRVIYRDQASNVGIDAKERSSLDLVSACLIVEGQRKLTGRTRICQIYGTRSCSVVKTTVSPADSTAFLCGGLHLQSLRKCRQCQSSTPNSPW
jgi:hypothetical protein